MLESRRLRSSSSAGCWRGSIATSPTRPAGLAVERSQHRTERAQHLDDQEIAAAFAARLIAAGEGFGAAGRGRSWRTGWPRPAPAPGFAGAPGSPAGKAVWPAGPTSPVRWPPPGSGRCGPPRRPRRRRCGGSGARPPCPCAASGGRDTGRRPPDRPGKEDQLAFPGLGHVEGFGGLGVRRRRRQADQRQSRFSLQHVDGGQQPRTGLLAESVEDLRRLRPQDRRQRFFVETEADQGGGVLRQQLGRRRQPCRRRFGGTPPARSPRGPKARNGWRCGRGRAPNGFAARGPAAPLPACRRSRPWWRKASALR